MTDAFDLAYPDPMRGAESTFTNQDPSKLPSGLTKREYFAAMAMQGLCALDDKNSRGATVLECWQELATHSVLIADCLIEQLNK